MAEEKRERLIEAAIRLFDEKGFESTSIQEIAAAADVAKGTVYLYFPSKDRLIAEVFQYCHRREVEASDEGLEREPSAIAKLQRRMRNAILWRLSHDAEANVEIMYLNTPGRGEGTRYQQQAHFHSVDAIIRAGIAAGEFKNAPSGLLGEAFFGIGGAFNFYFKDHPERIEDETIWELCMQMVKGCLLR